jgi:hypothetical protein
LSWARAIELQARVGEAAFSAAIGEPQRLQALYQSNRDIMNLSFGQVPKGRLLLHCEISPRHHRYSKPIRMDRSLGRAIAGSWRRSRAKGERINIAAL